MKKQQDFTLEELKKGYQVIKQGYRCNFCDMIYETGEIYPIDQHFYDAKKAIGIHMQKQHGSVFDRLIDSDRKINTLTDNQKQLLKYMQEGKSDKEIAALTNTSYSTIRHQRFVFREKAKQAKMYLALYDLAMEKRVDDLVQIHDNASQVDERFVATCEEEQEVISAMFSSLQPLRLKQFPAKEKKKILVLKKIMEGIDDDRKISEKELNGYLKEIYDDFVTLRRYLIEYGFLYRTSDCKYYAVHKEDLLKDTKK